MKEKLAYILQQQTGIWPLIITISIALILLFLTHLVEKKLEGSSLFERAWKQYKQSKNNG